MPADVQPFSLRGPRTFYGPFAGYQPDINPRMLAPGAAADCNNVVVRKGRVTHRPGIQPIVPDTSQNHLNDYDALALRYMDGDADYIISVAERDSVGLQHYDEHYEPASLGKALVRHPFGAAYGVIGRWGMDAYLVTADGPYRFVDGLHNREVQPAGMQPFDTTVGAATVAASASAGDMTGDLTVWVSRYNALLGVESNALELGTVTSVAAKQLDIDIANPHGYRTHATHVRIYLSRADGYGFPGLIAEVELPDPDSGSDFAYALGDPAVGNEQNGGSTYATADDDTNINYAPPSQNGVPPVNATCFAYHQARGWWGTDDGRIYFSQSVDELQGHVEHVAALSYRTVPRNERIVALVPYQEGLYVFTQRRVYRISGQVNSATNAQRVQGTLDDAIASTDAIDEVEGSVGCISPQSVIRANTPRGERIYFAGPGHAYEFDGITCRPISENRVETEYDRLCGLSRSGIVSAAHQREDDLIVFCFTDAACLCYDVVTGEWVRWLNEYPKDFGPVATRAINRVTRDDVIALQRRLGAAATTNRVYTLRFFDSSAWYDSFDGSVQPFLAYWTGPDLTMGRPERDKTFVYLHAFFTPQPDDFAGKVRAQVYRNGQSDELLPELGVGDGWDQDVLGDVEVVERLGFRARSAQPHFELARTLIGRSELLGYGLEYTVVGRR
jgi:hypothetical protein